MSDLSAFTTLQLFLIFISITDFYSQAKRDETDPGHDDLKPLGKQRITEGHIDVTDKLPSPVEFFEKYIDVGKPVVFKGVAKGMPAFQTWKDDYLRTRYGYQKVNVEQGKKENRSLRTMVYSMADFIDRYRSENIYMVHSLDKVMREDVSLLPSLSCGGYTKMLQDIIVWLSNGGTNSVLHNDQADNINCLLSGTKNFYLVDKVHEHLVHIDDPDGGYSKVDTDAVDLKKYPGFSDAPWWEAKLEAGDCIYIPYRWFHQIRSYGRNLAVNVWFTHPTAINHTECENFKWENHYISLSNLKLRSLAGVRQMLVLELNDRTKVTKEDFERLIEKHLYGVSKEEMTELVNMLDKNKDDIITREDVEALSDVELEKVREVMPYGSIGEAEDASYTEPSSEGSEDGHYPEEPEFHEILPEDEDMMYGMHEQEAGIPDFNQDHFHTEL